MFPATAVVNATTPYCDAILSTLHDGRLCRAEVFTSLPAVAPALPGRPRDRSDMLNLPNFHEVAIGDGTLTLPWLEARVDRSIASAK